MYRFGVGYLFVFLLYNIFPIIAIFFEICYTDFMKKTSAQEFLAKIPENLRKLADACQFSLYIVGGSVRDYLSGYPLPENADWDISAPAEESALLAAANTCGFTARAVYRATGTVKLEDSAGKGYEFTRFRSDEYVRGVHTPVEIFFTEDINLDARRRDFCANAVYFDIKRGAFLDPLGGIPDIEKRILRTVAPAEKVFGEDGLRLMRLARISAQTGFLPDQECLEGARRNVALVKDIVPERRSFNCSSAPTRSTAMPTRPTAACVCSAIRAY